MAGCRQVAGGSAGQPPALRHTYASALIAAGLDVITVQHKMGHATATTTLNTYGHLFRKDDTAAVNAIEAVLGTKKQQSP